MKAQVKQKMMNYIATLYNGSDFWIFLRTDSSTKILEFFYADEAEARKCAELAKAAAEAVSGQAFEQREVFVDFAEATEGYLFIDESSNAGTESKGSQQRSFTGSSERECLDKAISANSAVFDKQGMGLAYEL